MFNFILKNSLVKKSKLILTSITIILACMVGLLSINVSQQVNDGIIGLSGGYDVAIGPSGSDTQLAFNTLFFSEDPLGTIDYKIYEDLKSDERINVVIPFAMADSFGNYKVVGTENTFLKDYKLKGELFDESFECVVGYNVAKNAKLNIGDTVFTTHGAMGGEHNEPIKVVGILNKTNTNYDNVVFAQIDTIWDLHGESHSHENETNTEHSTNNETHTTEVDEHSEHDGHNVGLTSILLKTKSPRYQSEITTEYSKMHGVQTITPTVVLRKSLQSIDMSKQIVYALTGVIFVMSVMLLFIITLLTAQDLRKDIKLLRLLGVSSMKIKTIFIIQSSVVSIVSLIISFILSHISLGYINSISTGYGIVINPAKIYSIEYGILAIMFIVTLLPILLYMSRFFKKDITKI